MGRKKQIKAEKQRVIYSKNDDGQWQKITFAQQCTHEFIFGGRCQGKLGHDKYHWKYKEDGSFEFEHKKPVDHIASGWTPPGHANYVHPSEMAQYYYMRYQTTTIIKSKKLIKQLENDTYNGNAAIVRPINYE